MVSDILRWNKGIEEFMLNRRSFEMLEEIIEITGSKIDDIGPRKVPSGKKRIHHEDILDSYRNVRKHTEEVIGSKLPEEIGFFAMNPTRYKWVNNTINSKGLGVSVAVGGFYGIIPIGLDNPFNPGTIIFGSLVALGIGRAIYKGISGRNVVASAYLRTRHVEVYEKYMTKEGLNLIIGHELAHLKRPWLYGFLDIASEGRSRATERQIAQRFYKGGEPNHILESLQKDKKEFIDTYNWIAYNEGYKKKRHLDKGKTRKIDRYALGNSYFMINEIEHGSDILKDSFKVA